MDSTLNEKQLKRAAEPLSRLHEELSKLSHEAVGLRPDPRTASINTFRPAVSGNRTSFGGWVGRGFAGILLAAGIGIVGFIWLGSSGDAAKTTPSQPAALAQTAPTAAVSAELTPLLQSMARDLANLGQEIEQLKAGRDQMALDNANLSEQLKASQEQLTRGVARLSEQIRTSQEQVARDNANMAEQIKGVQDQLVRVISQASEQNAPPKIAAMPPRLPSPQPRPAALAARKPVPAVASAPAASAPKGEKPRLSSASPPPPVR